MLKKHKVLLSSCILLFLVGCSDKNEDNVDKPNSEPIIIADNKVDDNKEKKTNEKKNEPIDVSTLTFERSLDKDMMYYSIMEDVWDALNNRSSEEIDKYVSYEVIQSSKFDKPYEYYHLKVKTGILENIDDDKLNEAEKEMKKLSIKYKNKKIEIINYLNQYYNKEKNIVDLPISEYEKYDKMNDELNQILKDNKYLFLDTFEYYFKETPNYAYDDAQKMDIYFKNTDALVQNELSHKLISEITQEELRNVLVNNPAFAISYFNSLLSDAILNKNKDGIEYAIGEVKEFIKQEQNSKEYRTIVAYQDYLDELNKAFNDKEFIALINDGNYEELLYKVSYVNEYFSAKYRNKSKAEESSNSLLLNQAFKNVEY